MNISDLFTRVDKLTVDEAREIIDKEGLEKIIVLDVREPAEYEGGHIPGAVFIPLSKLPDRLSSLDVSKTVVTYCKRGPRSRSAAVLLKQQGGGNVYYMDGGMDGWNGYAATGQYEAGLLLLQGRETIEELIALAWSLEDGTGLFYKAVKDLLNNDEAEKVFHALINAEETHKSRLMEACRQITGKELTAEQLQSLSLKGYIEGGISMDEAMGWIKKGGSALADILEICMQVEVNSLDLYLKLYRKPEAKEAQKAFLQLIEEEKGHLAKLGELLNSTIGK